MAEGTVHYNLCKKESQNVSHHDKIVLPQIWPWDDLKFHCAPKPWAKLRVWNPQTNSAVTDMQYFCSMVVEEDIFIRNVRGEVTLIFRLHSCVLCNKFFMALCQGKEQILSGGDWGSEVHASVMLEHSAQSLHFYSTSLSLPTLPQGFFSISSFIYLQNVLLLL